MYVIYATEYKLDEIIIRTCVYRKQKKTNFLFIFISRFHPHAHDDDDIIFDKLVWSAAAAAAAAVKRACLESSSHKRLYLYYYYYRGPITFISCAYVLISCYLFIFFFTEIISSAAHDFFFNRFATFFFPYVLIRYYDRPPQHAEIMDLNDYTSRPFCRSIVQLYRTVVV